VLSFGRTRLYGSQTSMVKLIVSLPPNPSSARIVIVTMPAAVGATT
jgi:hypothetical protein